jgi:hypothetical protein
MSHNNHLPEFVFLPVRGYGLRTMALRKYKCVGEGEMPVRAGGPRRPCWFTRFSKDIWIASERAAYYKANGVPDIVRLSKNETYLTLSGAITKLEKYRLSHLEHLYAQRRRFDGELRNYQQLIDTCVRDILYGKKLGFDITELMKIAAQ